MYLVISEKPSVAQTIAKVLGAYQTEDGYLSGRDCIVSWCLGIWQSTPCQRLTMQLMESGGLMTFRLSRENGNWKWRRRKKSSLWS